MSFIKSSIKVSVIVPVYNTEKYLVQCLDSLVNQTLKEIEIICVNDGSTDGSLVILNQYAKQDKRIKIINKDNGGPSSARNLGINLAKGEYLTFVDSDDWVETSMCQLAYNKATYGKVDLVLFNMFFANGGKIQRINFTGCAKFKKTIVYQDIKGLVLNRRISVYARLYKTNFLRERQIFFSEGLLYEDGPFMMEVLLQASSINVLHKNLYYHRKGSVGSIMSSSHATYQIFDIFKVARIIKEKLQKLGKYQEFMKEFFIFKVCHFGVWFWRCSWNMKPKFLWKILREL
ncbi:MAG: glycosyltransferase [Deltaproteobacteria bacterium]|jgi:glycosyltransferase involved in cell wall biosynthesis|nr:glycosyltransferase [Deltaproteobacteria bacterium]